MSFDTTLRRIARRLPDYPLPAAVRPRLMDRLKLQEESRRPASPRMKPILAGVAATAVIGLGIKAVYFPEDSFLKVNQAVLQTNSFHLVGWKLKDGQKVPWEIWGRRNPAFYREQVGEEITVMSGKQAINSLSSTLRNEKNGFVYLVHPAKRLSNYYMRDRSIARLAGTGIAFLQDQNPQVVTLPDPERANPESEKVWQLDDGTKTISVDKKTNLPVHLVMSDRNLSSQTNISYRVQEKGETQERPVTGQLDASYNIPIPEELEQFEPAPNSSVLPITLSKNSSQSGWLMGGMGRPVENYSSTGLAVVVRNTRIDSEGNLRLSLNVKLGDQPYSEAQMRLPLYLNYMSASMTRGMSANTAEGKYTFSAPLMHVSRENSIHGNAIEIVMVPVEPILWKKETPQVIQISGMLVMPLFKPDVPAPKKENQPKINEFPGAMIQEIYAATIAGQFTMEVPFSKESVEESSLWKETGQLENYEKAFFRSGRFNGDRAELAWSMMGSSILYDDRTDPDGSKRKEQLKAKVHYAKLALYWSKLAAETAEKDGRKYAVPHYKDIIKQAQERIASGGMDRPQLSGTKVEAITR